MGKGTTLYKRINRIFGIKNRQTILMTILIFISLSLSIALILKLKPDHFFIKSLFFIFSTIIMGLIISIFSNYLYDKHKEYFENDLFKSIEKSGLINLFQPKLDRETRDKITLDRMRDLKGDVYLLAIAASSYLPKRDRNIKEFTEIFINRLLEEEKIKLKLILLNPYSEAAKFRFARENCADVDSILKNQDSNYRKSQLFIDINDTIEKVKRLKRLGADIDLRLTNFEPIISTMLTEDFSYVDILSLGKENEIEKETENDIGRLDSTLPIMEFKKSSRYYEVIKSHFDYHFKYSISIDEFENQETIFKDKFYSLSYTGFKLIKQHDSWISIDPIVGCNRGCHYCVLQTTFGNKVKPKVLFENIDFVVNQIKDSFLYKKNKILSIGNYTDILLPQNQDYLIRLLQNLTQKNISNWIIIPTKEPLKEELINKLYSSYNNIKLFISYFNPETQNGLIETMKILKEKKICSLLETYN